MEFLVNFGNWMFGSGDDFGLLVSFIVTLLGLVGLYFGSDFLIKGGVNLAIASGVKKVVVGLTVVAFGTSLPEMIVSMTSTISENYSFAIGNVIGSNIANIALVLGIAALINPIDVENVVVKFDMWIVVASSVLFMIVASDGVINVFEGILLLIGFASYIMWLFYTANERNVEDEVDEIDKGKKNKNIILNLILVAVGIFILSMGARFTIKGGESIASAFGVPELIIGLTIVALGTSLPELVTAVLSQIKKESDITVGNVIGSNIFNILLVIGAGAVVTPFVVDDPINQGLIVENDAIKLHLPIMLAIAILLLPLLSTNRRLKRWEGLLLLICYTIYIIYIVSTGRIT